MGRSLLNRTKISSLSKGIHDSIVITNIDTKDRRGQNGPINKMIYIKFAQITDDGKRLAESELSWWKPDPSSEYFKINLQEICLQLHNIVSCYVGEDKAFDAFKDVFNSTVTSHEELEDKKWKQSEVNTLNTALKDAFVTVMTPFINSTDSKLRMKLTTNYKGEDVEIPKYGLFLEPMTVTDSMLKFTAAELKTHSKSGTVIAKTAASSADTNSTI